VKSDGLALRYVEWGDPGAPTIVALHGLRSFAYTWEPVAQPLASRFRVVALDQRGRGLSDWDPARSYYTESYVRDLEALVDKLELETFLLLGHSMGGATAFVYASHHPDRLAGLAIEDIGPGSSANSSGAERIRRELVDTPGRFGSWFEATAFWRHQRPDVSEAALQARVLHSMKATDSSEVVWRHDAHGIAEARLNATPAQLVDLWPYVEQVSRPTLLLRGARSDFLSADIAADMCRRNRNIQCEEIPSAGHYVHDDNLGGFAGALHRFLHSPALRPWAKGQGDA
jgi:pimeloyl-ACP methyl ester carboxylesterase